MKYISIDIETTGLDPKNCDIVEFGAVIDDLNDIKQIEELPKFHCYFLPQSGIFHGEPYALSMHPQIFRRIAKQEAPYQYLHYAQFPELFVKFLESNGYVKKYDRISFNVAGKNFMGFDHKFISAKTKLFDFVQCNQRVLDPAILYYVFGDNFLPDMKKCRERAGLSGEVDHTSIEDAITVINLVRNKLIGG